MSNNEIFKQGYIFLDIDLKNKEELFEYVASIADEKEICKNIDGLIQKLKEREEISSTGFEKEIAIPHTQYEEISKASVLFMRLKKGINWNAMDGGLSRLFFCILVPKNNNNGDQHIEILGNLASKMMDDNFIKTLSETHEKQEILNLVIDKKNLQNFNDSEPNKSEKKDYYLAVSACTFGLAHTYIAEQKLLNFAKEKNFDIKVETHGSKGDLNLINEEDLKKAKGVLIACDKDIDLSRIKHENIYKVRTIDAIQNTQYCFDVLDGKIKINKNKQMINDFFKMKLQQVSSHSIGKTYNFIRYFALIIGILIFINSFLHPINFISNNDLIPIISFSSMIVGPLFAFLIVKFFTKSEGTALSAGVVLFSITAFKNFKKNNLNLANLFFLNYGILGIIIISLFAILYHKYVFKLNDKVFKNKKMRGGFKWFFQIILVLAIFFIIFYTFDKMAEWNNIIFGEMIKLDDQYWWFRFIVASLYLFLMMIDMGGPINKWAIITSAMFMTESFAIDPTNPWLTPITAQVLGITMPGISLFVRSKILANRLSDEEKKISVDAGLKAWNGISEGALWVLKKYTWKAHLSNLILSIYCGFLIGFLNIETYGGYNTILGTIFGFSTDNILNQFGLDYMSFNIGFLLLTFTGPIFGGVVSSFILWPKKEVK